jgi:hypothetical protein
MAYHCNKISRIVFGKIKYDHVGFALGKERSGHEE